MTRTLQQRARYAAAWAKDHTTATLLREMADRLDLLEKDGGPPCVHCHGTGRRWPFVAPGCGAYGVKCRACKGTGRAAE